MPSRSSSCQSGTSGLSSAISAAVTRGESRRQATHRSADSVLIARTSPGAYPPRPGSPPTSSDRAPRPAAVTVYLRRDTSSGAVCDGPQVDDGTAWEVVYAFGRNIKGGNPSKGSSKPSEGHRIPRSRVAPDSGRRRARRNGEALFAFFQHAVEKAGCRPVYRLNEHPRQSAATLRPDWVS